MAFLPTIASGHCLDGRRHGIPAFGRVGGAGSRREGVVHREDAKARSWLAALRAEGFEPLSL